MVSRKELSEVEREEFDREVQLSNDIKMLMADETFRRVILDGYINDNALSIGSAFVGSVEQVEGLKAISHLKRYLEVNLIME